MGGEYKNESHKTVLHARNWEWFTHISFHTTAEQGYGQTLAWQDSSSSFWPVPHCHLQLSCSRGLYPYLLSHSQDVILKAKRPNAWPGSAFGCCRRYVCGRPNKQTLDHVPGAQACSSLQMYVWCACTCTFWIQFYNWGGGITDTWVFW